MTKWILLFVLVSCGEVETLQNNISAFTSQGDFQSDQKVQEVFEGFFHKKDPSNSNSYTYIDYANTRYYVRSISSSAQTQINSLDPGIEYAVYFKGSLDKSQGFLGDPNTNYDVIDLELLKRK